MVVFVIMFTVALFSSVFGIPSAHAESWHETADIQDYGQKIIRREILTPPPVFIIPPFITGELITENDYMIFDEHGGWWIDLIVALEKRPGDRPIASSTNAAGTVDPDGGLLKYRWDFDGDNAWDTQWSYTPTVSHAWDDDFSGNILLEVFDGTFKDVAEVEVTVSNSAPQMDIYGDSNAEEGFETSFTGVIIDLGVEDTHTISWDFGDGNTAYGTYTPSHTYTQSGAFTVTATVTDDDGGVGTGTFKVTVENLPLVFNAGPDLDAVEGYEVTVWTTWEGEKLDSYDITWDMGDGSPLKTGNFNAKHTYVDDGVYVATLTVIDGDLAPATDSVTHTRGKVPLEGRAGVQRLRYQVLSRFHDDREDKIVSYSVTDSISSTGSQSSLFL
jgi:hypothetical protein